VPRIWITLLLAVASAGSVRGIDTTIVLDAEQSWSRDGRQKSLLATTIELSHSFSRDSAITAIVRAQFIGPDQLDPGEHSQASVSPASRRFSVNDTLEVELREFYWDLDLDRAQLRLGKQQVVWGQADGLKVLDVVNPQSFRQFILEDFDDSRIPIWMVNLELALDLGDLQLLWIPDTSMHSLPTAGSTFEFTAPFANIPSFIPISIKPVDRPDSILSDSDFGIRLAAFRGGWDVTLNYMYHYDDFPVLRKQVGPGGLGLTPVYERTHTLGGTASNSFGSFVLRTELAFNTDKYVDATIIGFNQGVEKSRELSYVIGLDWSGLRDTLLSAQIFQSRLLDDGRYSRDDTETNFTFLLRRNFLNESFLLELLWIYHENDKDNLMRLKSQFELTSNINISLYADFFNGKPDQLFGQFEHRDQVGLRLTVGW